MPRLIDADVLDEAIATADYYHEVDRNKTQWLVYKAPTINPESLRLRGGVGTC